MGELAPTWWFYKGEARSTKIDWIAFSCVDSERLELAHLSGDEGSILCNDTKLTVHASLRYACATYDEDAPPLRVIRGTYFWQNPRSKTFQPFEENTASVMTAWYSRVCGERDNNEIAESKAQYLELDPSFDAQGRGGRYKVSASWPRMTEDLSASTSATITLESLAAYDMMIGGFRTSVQIGYQAPSSDDIVSVLPKHLWYHYIS